MKTTIHICETERREDMMHFESDALILHTPKNSDLVGLRRIMNDSKVYRLEPTYLPESGLTPDEALVKFQNLELERDRQCILGIYRKSDPETLVGLAELYDYKPSGRIISVGCRLAQDFWGCGIATSCAEAMIEFLMAETQVSLITAHCIPENLASQKSLTKAGFEHLQAKYEDWGYAEPTRADIYAYNIERNN